MLSFGPQVVSGSLQPRIYALKEYRVNSSVLIVAYRALHKKPNKVCFDVLAVRTVDQLIA